VIGRVVEIATPGTRLRKARGSLSIQAPGEPPETIPLDALEAVILHDAATLSVAAINALLDAGTNVVFCDGKQRPVSMVLPFEGHHVQAGRMQLQLAASQPLRKRLWQSIVQTKIERQSEVLERVTHSRALLPFICRVRSGDPDNIEAQAARIYWRALFGPAFHRGRFPDPANALLNYGYAVVRAAMARAVTATGLHPSFALH
jgi:CRISPR-associated protein Cas1